MNRRTFLRDSITMSGLAASAVAFGQTQPTPPAVSSVARGEPPRPSPLEVATVKEFVGAGHGNLARVKEMIAAQPKLLLASYDWGAGDFETALGGASHMGRPEIALFLLEAGARVDAFTAAMLGQIELVKSLLHFSPATAATKGPHRYTLLYHAGYSGKVAMAEAIVAQLKDPALHCNQGLQTATARGHTELVAWLLRHGANDVNTKNFSGRTPLDVAVAQQHAEIAALLRAAGGVTTF